MKVKKLQPAEALLALGNLRNHDGNAKENVASNISLRFLYFFAIIPIHSTCRMRTNYPVTERVGTAFKLIQRKENLPSCAHVFHKILNLVISRCCLAKYGEENYVPKFITHVQGLLFFEVLIAVAVVAS